ncbi:hypothetical protein AB0H73_06265 [Streptomyces olivoreticuli]
MGKVEISADSVEAELLDAFGKLAGLPFTVNSNTGEVRLILNADWERQLLEELAATARTEPPGMQEAA